MREIIFRAWDKLGFDGMVENVQFRREERTFDQYPNTDEGRYILMQFTGLKDENGKKGFFDDIIQDEGDRYIVQWDDDEGVAYLKAILESSIDFSIQAITYRKIIGNKWENPELLNG